MVSVKVDGGSKSLMLLCCYFGIIKNVIYMKKDGRIDKVKKVKMNDLFGCQNDLYILKMTG